MSETRQISDSRIHQIISLIDLTNLADKCDLAAIETLCAQARTPVGYVAAVCIWPAFVYDAKRILGEKSPVKIATVVNFPTGDDSLQNICTAIDKALADGADEIDYVLPYNAMINGNVGEVVKATQTVRKHVGANKTLKVILETGKLENTDLTRTAASIAIDQGADFIKTSTGKVPVNATPEAAKIMLDTILYSKNDVGFKAAGGIRTVEDANTYLELSEQRFGRDWADASHFRFGASSLLQDALMKLKIDSLPSTNDDGGY